jgi:hypothetical protein
VPIMLAVTTPTPHRIALHPGHFHGQAALVQVDNGPVRLLIALYLLPECLSR